MKNIYSYLVITLFILFITTKQQQQQDEDEEYDCQYNKLDQCIAKWINATNPATYNNEFFQCMPYSPCSDKDGCQKGGFQNTTFKSLRGRPGDALTLSSHVCLSAGKSRSTDMGCHLQSCSQIGYDEDVYGNQCLKFPFEKYQVSNELLLSDEEIHKYKGWFRRSSIHKWYKYEADEGGYAFSPDACLGMESFFAAPPVKDKEINEKMKQKMTDWLYQAKQGNHEKYYYKINIDNISPTLSLDKDIYQKIYYEFIIELPEGVKKFSDKNHNSHKLQYLQIMIENENCDCDDELFYQDNSLFIKGYANCPYHNLGAFGQCIVRPDNLGMFYLLFKMRGLKPTCSMKFWKMTGVNSQYFLGTEARVNKLTTLHLQAQEVFIRILLNHRGVKTSYKHVKKVIYNRQVKLDSNKQGTNRTNPLFTYLMYFDQPDKYEEIAKDLVDKCSKVNIQDYKSNVNRGREWAWQRPGWDPNDDIAPWDKSWGFDCIAVAQYLLNPDWYLT